MDYVNIAAKTSAFQGEGTIYFQYPHSKDSMTCSFENGVKNGNAVLFDKNRTVLLKCTYVNDSIEGNGDVFSGGQLTFRGEFGKNDINGYGHEEQSGWVTYEGYYKDGKRNGLGQEKDMYGTSSNYCVYDNGTALNAVVKPTSDNRYIIYIYDATDKLESMGYIDPVSGKLNGLGARFHEDGSISDICTYAEGSLVLVSKSFKGREMTEYDSNGEVVYIGEYEMIDDLEYNRHGNGTEYEGLSVMLYSGGFEHNERSGYGKEFHHGICVYDGAWKAGKRNGFGSSFDESGARVFSGEWRDGEKVEMPQYPPVSEVTPEYPPVSETAHEYPPVSETTPHYPPMSISTTPEYPPLYPAATELPSYPYQASPTATAFTAPQQNYTDGNYGQYPVYGLYPAVQPAYPDAAAVASPKAAAVQPAVAPPKAKTSVTPPKTKITLTLPKIKSVTSPKAKPTVTSPKAKPAVTSPKTKPVAQPMPVLPPSLLPSFLQEVPNAYPSVPTGVDPAASESAASEGSPFMGSLYDTVYPQYQPAEAQEALMQEQELAKRREEERRRVEEEERRRREEEEERQREEEEKRRLEEEKKRKEALRRKKEEERRRKEEEERRREEEEERLRLEEEERKKKEELKRRREEERRRKEEEQRRAEEEERRRAEEEKKRKEELKRKKEEDKKRKEEEKKRKEEERKKREEERRRKAEELKKKREEDKKRKAEEKKKKEEEAKTLQSMTSADWNDLFAASDASDASDVSFDDFFSAQPASQNGTSTKQQEKPKDAFDFFDTLDVGDKPKKPAPPVPSQPKPALDRSLEGPFASQQHLLGAEDSAENSPFASASGKPLPAKPAAPALLRRSSSYDTTASHKAAPPALPPHPSHCPPCR